MKLILSPFKKLKTCLTNKKHNMKILTVTKSLFLDWYWDYSMQKELGFEVVRELKETGSYSITAEDSFYNAGYIPFHLVNEELPEVFEEHFEEEEFYYNEFEVNGEKYQLVLVDETPEGEQVMIKAGFEYDSMDFDITGLANKEDVEEGIPVGYVEGGDMMTDAEGFDIHTIIYGKADFEAYCKVNDGSTGEVQWKIVE